MKTTLLFKTFWGLLFLLVSTCLSAGVNIKNGNFYISYADIRLPGSGHDLKLTRTYNSKSVTQGWFGVGWGTPFETRLVINVDGSVTVVENGSGAKTRFTSKRGDAAQVEKAVEQIVKAMRDKGGLGENYINKISAKLKNSAYDRDKYAKKFNVRAQMPSDSVLYSSVRGAQKLQRTQSGYKRIHEGGKTDFFDSKGRLVKVVGKNYFFNLNYKNGVLKSIKDSEGKQIFFSWYENGLVKSIWSGSGKKKATYTYEGRKLKKSIDTAHNVYQYQYDNNYNMTSIRYKNGSQMKISYHPKTQFVKKIIGRDGQHTEYKYGSNPKNPDYHYWTTVTKQMPGRKSKPRVSRYEYEIKVKPNGSQYTHRVITDINGDRTETTYSQCCSLPLTIKRGKELTQFEYNKQGLLTKKVSSKGEFVRIQYDSKFNKISRVENNKGWTNFKYNNKGALSVAKNNRGESFVLLYELKGKIAKVIYTDKNKKKETLNFKYNTLGKPVEISMKGVGKMNVIYNNVGKVKNVKSDKGARVANRVTRTFLSLLAVVKPAGVNLNSI